MWKNGKRDVLQIYYYHLYWVAPKESGNRDPDTHTMALTVSTFFSPTINVASQYSRLPRILLLEIFFAGLVSCSILDQCQPEFY